METITIIDINGSKKNISSMEIVHEDSTSYVKVNVVGKTGREWPEFYPIDDFMNKNPDIENQIMIMMNFNNSIKNGE